MKYGVECSRYIHYLRSRIPALTVGFMTSYSYFILYGLIFTFAYIKNTRMLIVNIPITIRNK